MSVKNSFYNEYDIKNNENYVLWAQRSFQIHHQTFHHRCPEKIGPLPKKSDHWFTRTCPENMGQAPTWLFNFHNSGYGRLDKICLSVWDVSISCVCVFHNLRVRSKNFLKKVVHACGTFDRGKSGLPIEVKLRWISAISWPLIGHFHKKKTSWWTGRPKTQVDIAVLDFVKAFDSLPHDKLLSKLQHYSIHAWISSFLKDMPYL